MRPNLRAWPISRYAFAGVIFLQLLLTQPVIGQTLLDFEGISGAQVSTQYSTQGVTFNFPTLRDYASTPGFAHSGTKAVELCFAAEFCKAKLVAKFTAGQSHVKVFVGASYPVNAPLVVELGALDQNGNVVATTNATLGPSSGTIPVNVLLEVQSTTANIREIRAGSASPDAFNNGLVFDDLSMDTAGPQPQCAATSNPAMTMNEPVSGTTTQINEFRLRGSISTGAPLESATLTIAGPNNQQSTSDLLGTIVQPATAGFGPTNVTGSLFAGTNVITLTAKNCHGTSQRTSTVVFGPVTQGTQVKLLGMELVQSTQDTLNSVPLLRDKATLLRLYFATTGGPDILSVRGDVSGYKQGGNTPFLAQSLGTTTITSSTDLATKRSTLTGSMNFLLSPDFYGPGQLNFRVLRLYVDGPGGNTLTCVGCQNWTADFPDVPRLNLVIQPYFYAKSSKTADVGASLMNALRHLNNVYPLKGDFPLDSSGLQIFLQPMLTLSLDLPRDDGRVLYQLENILDDLKSQPGSGIPADAYILGVGPSGAGVANMDSKVAYGDSRAIEDAPQPSDPEWYGSVWAQELGHAFGLPHVSTSHGEMSPTDSAFPYPHGGIGEPGIAITTEGWNGSTPFLIAVGNPASGSKHAHDFMSYGSVNDSADHTNSWVSPYTYKKLRQKIMSALPATMSAHAPSADTDKLIVGGVIGSDGSATLAPSRIVKTSYAKGLGETGSLTIMLSDASGRALSTYRFDPKPVVHGAGASFNEFVPWVPGTRTVVLKRRDTTLATITVSQNKPNLSSVRARVRGPKSATVTWVASDPDGDPLSFDVLFNNGVDRRWVPVAMDVTGTSAKVDTSLLPKSARSRFRVRASDGVNSSEADSPIVSLGDSAPVPVILTTAGTQPINAKTLRLEGAAYDPRDGLLPASRLRWTSNRDGLIGTGRVLAGRRLSSGKHVITLTATNKRGTTAIVRRVIVVR